MNKYYDSHFDKQVVTIYPGEYYSTGSSEMISTVLGSCVSIALYDAEAGVGGLNHFMLARDSRVDNEEGDRLMGKFGEYAIKLLIDDLKEKGGRQDRFAAKVFGGGNIFNLPNTGAQVGDVNSRFAFEYLKQIDIPVVSSNTGGNFPRKLFFDPVRGKVFMKFINNSRLTNSGLIEKEKNYVEKIEQVELTKVKDLFR